MSISGPLSLQASWLLVSKSRKQDGTPHSRSSWFLNRGTMDVDWFPYQQMLNRLLAYESKTSGVSCPPELMVPQQEKEWSIPLHLLPPGAHGSSTQPDVLTQCSHKTPPESECPAVSHTRETGSEQATGVELYHPGHQGPQGSLPLSSASLSCSRTQECHGRGP